MWKMRRKKTLNLRKFAEINLYICRIFFQYET